MNQPLQMPLFTVPSDWRPPQLADLPDWTGAKRVGIDIETCDPYLKQLGPSVRRGGFIAGVSFAIEDGPGFYLPIRHEGGDNLPAENVLAYLKDQAQRYSGIIVGANFNYDLDYLEEAGITFPKVSRVRDIQIADPLINELHNSYRLDVVAERWGIPGKDEKLLDEALANYGLKKGDMWRLPARYVGPYATWDAELPLKLLRKQERVIDDRKLWDIYDLESRVQPVCLKMRRRGVRIDLKALDEIRAWSLEEEAKALERIFTACGVRIGVGNVWGKEEVAPALSAIGVVLKETKTGQPQIDAELLASIDHPVSRDLGWARKVNKLGQFVSSIEEHLVGDRIHCTFNQMRRTKQDGDDKGARYGRMSSEHPNLQQQPVRGEHAKQWRKIYVPDHPNQQWLSADYSQQEPRMTTHFAEVVGLRGAERAANAYRTNPDTDNHQMMADLCDIPRKPAKNIYLGLCYGMGGARLAHELGLPTKHIRSRRSGSIIEVAGDEAQALLDKFNRHAPFVRGLAKRCEETAQSRGYIITLLGRHLHFPKIGESEYDWTHKALNRLIQGSSADQTKKAMVEIDAAGLPLQLQVHDEVDASIDHLDQAYAIKEIMENCVTINVPSKVDLEVGPSWGEATTL